MKYTLTNEDLRNGIKAMQSNDGYQPLFWVNNEHWYKGEEAKTMRFDCTDEEIEKAKLDENGYIKSSSGVSLYLTRMIK